jgi:hypothetical protein
MAKVHAAHTFCVRCMRLRHKWDRHGAKQHLDANKTVSILCPKDVVFDPERGYLRSANLYWCSSVTRQRITNLLLLLHALLTVQHLVCQRISSQNRIYAVK